MKKEILVIMLLISGSAGLGAQELNDKGAIKFYPEQEKHPAGKGLLQYSLGIRMDYKALSDGDGLWLGVQGSMVHQSGLDWGIMASFLVNRSLQINTYPYTSYGYGYAGLWLGYGLMLGEQWRLNPKLNLALGGVTTSTSSTNAGGATIQGTGMLVPEVLLQYYISPLFALGLSVKYHLLLAEVPRAGLDAGDMEGFSIGLEMDFLMGK